MNGLLEQPMGPAAPTGQGAVPPQGAAPPGQLPVQAPGQPTAPGELDQEAVDIFVANGMKMIHNPKVSDTLISRIVDAENPVQAVADATLSIVSRLEESSKAAGRPLALPTIAYGANILMGEIMSSAEAAGMEKMDEATRYQTFSLAVGKYLDDAIKTGKMTKEELIRLGKEAEGTPIGQKMLEAARKGTLPAGETTAQPGMATPPGLMGGPNNGRIA